jgi:hypothetical protein
MADHGPLVTVTDNRQPLRLPALGRAAAVAHSESESDSEPSYSYSYTVTQ